MIILCSIYSASTNDNNCNVYSSKQWIRREAVRGTSRTRTPYQLLNQQHMSITKPSHYVRKHTLSLRTRRVDRELWPRALLSRGACSDRSARGPRRGSSCCRRGRRRALGDGDHWDGDAERRVAQRLRAEEQVRPRLGLPRPFVQMHL